LLVVSALGTTQTLAWASSYYLPAIIADRMAKDTGVSPVWIFAAFSISLAISGLFGPRVGRTIDLFGGRGVLAASNLIFAVGLCLLAMAHNPVMLTLGWIVMGAGMGIGLRYARPIVR
jgi:MFS family permease